MYQDDLIDAMTCIRGVPGLRVRVITIHGQHFGPGRLTRVNSEKRLIGIETTELEMFSIDEIKDLTIQVGVVEK